jgi:hypothetical protein
MQLGRYSSYGLLAVVVGIVGCTGNGVGLDANGQPITAGSTASSGPITADLASIEANVFTPICSKCHIGASAPEGLQLDAAHAYDFLVGVPSNEDPSLQRVNPGNPDASYMVLKIEGAPGIEGGQMPLGETPLPQATIDAIRQWITNGAPNVPAAAAAQAFEVRSAVPSDQSTVVGPLRQVVVAFTNEVDASLVNETTVVLERIALTEADAATTPIPVARRLVPANPSVLLLTPSMALAPGTYRVSVRGSGGGALADVNANALRSDTAITFTVEDDR